MSNTPIRSGNSIIDFVFDACVNFLLLLGALTGLSYNAVNVIVFCVMWPLLTIALLVFIFIQRQNNKKLKHRNQHES